MRKKWPGFCLNCTIYGLLILLVISAGIDAADNARVNSPQEILNFYTLQALPAEPRISSMTVLIPLYQEQTDHITFHLEDDFISDTEHRLPPERLTVTSSRTELSLSTEPQTLDIRADKTGFKEGSPVFLELVLKVMPADLPGEYRGTLIIAQPGPENGDLVKEAAVRFKVQPWLYLELESDIHKILTADFGDNLLYSTVPGRIVISGNTPWRLWVKGIFENQNYPAGKSELILNLSSEEKRLLIHEDSILLQKKELLLAESDLFSTDPGASLELIFNMQIRDFIHLTAGRISFPLKFRLEPIRREEL